jgi:hypothetical protein
LPLPSGNTHQFCVKPANRSSTKLELEVLGSNGSPLSSTDSRAYWR